jgi:YHS domain-containing protein
MNKTILTVIIHLLLGFTAIAQTNTEKAKHLNTEKGLAIQGYDPVAYFSNMATIGDKKYAVNHQGVVYYFSTEANKNAFLQNPAKYEPQYGGWCAFAMGDYGKKVDVNPETFKIVNGKLYLFYNAYFNNTLKSWNKDEKNLNAKADKNWSNILKSK